MINDPFHLEETASQQKESGKRMMLGVVCAVAITAIVLAVMPSCANGTRSIRLN